MKQKLMEVMKMTLFAIGKRNLEVEYEVEADIMEEAINELYDCIGDDINNFALIPDYWIDIDTMINIDDEEITIKYNTNTMGYAIINAETGEVFYTCDNERAAIKWAVKSGYIFA